MSRGDRVTGLHVITDARGGTLHVEGVAAALGAGVKVVQVRVKGLPDRAVHDFAAAVVALCAEHGATCIVNDRVDIALAVGAHGTHLGAEDLPMAAARSVVGPDHLLGGTARTGETAVRLVEEGADYLGVGPAYPTTTKTGLPDALGPAGVDAVATAVAVPVVAIGGVTPARVPELLAAGASGVAVVSAVSTAPDPAAAAREFLTALSQGPGR